MEIHYFKENNIEIRHAWTSPWVEYTFWQSTNDQIYFNGNNKNHKKQFTKSLYERRTKQPIFVFDLPYTQKIKNGQSYTLLLTNSGQATIYITSFWFRNYFNSHTIFPNVLMLIIEDYCSEPKVYSTKYWNNANNVGTTNEYGLYEVIMLKN